MEVVESPLNLAHQQCRKADRLLAAGKYEEAIACHRKAADLLKDAMRLTECEQARLSLELQRDSHIKQQRLIEEKWKRSKREAKPRPVQPCAASSDPKGQQQQQQGMSPSQLPLSIAGLDPAQIPGQREYDTLLYVLKHKDTARPPPSVCPPPTAGNKAHKDDKMRLEEQETTITQLRWLVETLVVEKEQLQRDCEALRTENERLKRRERERQQQEETVDFVEGSELWVLPRPACGGEERSGKAKDIAIPQLPPLEMPTQEIPLDKLSEDIQHQLQEILDGEKL